MAVAGQKAEVLSGTLYMNMAQRGKEKIMGKYSNPPSVFFASLSFLRLQSI